MKNLVAETLTEFTLTIPYGEGRLYDMLKTPVRVWKLVQQGEIVPGDKVAWVDYHNKIKRQCYDAIKKAYPTAKPSEVQVAYELLKVAEVSAVQAGGDYAIVLYKDWP